MASFSEHRPGSNQSHCAVGQEINRLLMMSVRLIDQRNPETGINEQGIFHLKTRPGSFCNSPTGPQALGQCLLNQPIAADCIVPPRFAAR